ncbi:hypothetical protein COT68_00790 [bacterium (Candidatus Torokbacteria) CG09_land_8_20_14_0_10_42_11]|nr:MAG: hypothetical protein COT68_00790 [bacterium (Candidatus Torokbacteria) CG09_land_8_20_14_0_10_42_11]
MDTNKFFQSKFFKGVLCGIAALIIILLIFKAGMIAGIKKAEFSGHWSDNYHRNFGGPPNGFGGNLGDRDFLEANGVFGQIIKIDGSAIIVKGRQDVEKVVLINDQTIIERFRETIKPENLKVDDNIVVIGEPSDAGQIVAKLIRILPPPESFKPLPMPRI